MKSKMFVGSENYDEIITQNGYFVDKTELMYELVAETSNKVTLFTRPRRFGKTLTMNMMESFFDIRRDSKKVFEGKNIMNHPEFCSEYMNQYPVVFLTFKDVDGKNFDEAYDMIVARISSLFKKHAYLINEANASKVDKDDIAIFQKIKAQDEKLKISEIKNSIDTLMRMMNAVYGKPVILLIDEYDVPLAKASAKSYYREMLDVIRGILSTSLKTNDFLNFAVVTGCLRIPKESIFTGVNNFASYSVLDEDFSQYFGFTEIEVKKLLADFGFSDKADIIKEWYDGYLFGETEVYCPWDVVSYIAALLKRKNAQPKIYWVNTGGHEAISAFFEMDDVDISDRFETLLNGGTITETVSTSLTYEGAYDTILNLWSVLLMTGYVTTVRQEGTSDDDETAIVELRIPNTEVSKIFQSAVVAHFKKTVDRTQITNLMNALWNGNTDEASEILSTLLWMTISFNDYKEDYYHAFLAGIFVGRGGYSVDSNKERGLGKPDIDLRDKRNKRAIIIEAKISKSEKSMAYWCNKALKQIQDNEYALHLEEYEQVLRYGIAFYKKKVMIKKM